MTWGTYAHRVEEGLPEAERARLASRLEPATPSTTVATVVRRSGPPPVRAVLDLQRSAGNRAVLQLLRRDVAVQRQDEEEYGDAGSSWATNEEAPAGSYSADDYSSGETYGPPPPPEWGDGGGGGDGGGTGGGGDAAASEWSSGGGGGGSGGGEASGGGGEPAPADEGSSWWPFGGGEETPRNEPGESAPGGDEGGGSSWWPFGGGEETPSGDEGGGSSWWPFGGGDEAPGGDDGGGSSWWPFGGEDTPRNEPGEGGDDEGPSQDDIDRKIAEGESGSEKDVFIPMGGGPNPVASSPAGNLGGFHDDGAVGTVPVGPSGKLEDPADAMNPHAFIRGGQTGTVAWAGGGGEGLGPKGNQGSGSLQSEIEPEYDYNWGGPFSKASSFVKHSTGVVDVHRSYVSSKPGDQGNGWWVSEAAANALTAHERKHVERAKDLYDRIIGPMEAKIADSATYGRERAYLGSTAKNELRLHIDWPRTVKKFKDEDMLENAPNNRVDNEDVGSPHYPEPRNDPRVIEGKRYEFWEIMHGEKPPP
ncbi:MAG TPA: hypothetical protein VFV72_14020 [Candidatus Limnocylindrales bacterium]|nr:hypothetical protein [Candidatus Limnocylindrales bacterium]